MGLAEILTKEPGEFTSEEVAEMEAFIREHQRRVFALCFRMTNSAEDAEDLCQETFVQACKHYRTFRGQSRISTWLYRIALNQGLNWRTRAERVRRLQEDLTLMTLENGTLPPGVKDEVNAALMKLNPKQRAAIVLTTYEDLSHGEAAQVLGCSEATVSWRVFMARRHLKTWLNHLSPGATS